MKTKAAVVYEPGKPIEIEELDLDGPQDGEVLIRYTARGPVPLRRPRRARRPRRRGCRWCSATRAPGIIEEVGPGVTRVAARRPRRLLVHPELRRLPLLRHRPPVDLRHGRDDPGGLPARRPVPDHRAARRVRRHVHARDLQPVRRHPPELGGQGRRRPAPGQGRARRLRRADRLGLGGEHRQRPRRRHGRDLRRRRHRHQRGAGRPLRRRQERRRDRPAGEQAREGHGARRDARVRHRRGGAGRDHRHDPRAGRRLRDPHRRPDDGRGRRRRVQRHRQGRHSSC